MKQVYTVHHDYYDDEGVEITAIDEEDAVEKAAQKLYYDDPCDPDKFSEVFICNGKTYTVSAWTDINFRVTDDGEV